MSRNYRPPVKDLRSKISGRKRRSEDVLTIQRPKRRRTVHGEGSNNATRPIGFEKLENICRESVPEKGILELASNAERFEALLASEEIRPDLLKLVISAFHLLCSANNLTKENAEKLLRSPAAKKFMTGPVLSTFVNEMPFSEIWKDERERVTVLSDLAEIFLALLQRLGESIVHKLPLPQLTTSLHELRKKNLNEDTSDVDKKIRQVNELKDQVIRRAKSAYDQESWNANRIMALRLAFLVCCALTGAGVKLLEAPVGATTVLITSNALVVLVMLLVFFWKETPSAVESSDTNEPHKVLEKLLEYEVPLQNIPSDPQKGENLVEAFKNSEGKIIVRDPDGYYLELCNCDVPTAFCLFKENAKEKKPGYVPKYKKLMDAI